jgi:hypothetical protein
LSFRPAMKKLWTRRKTTNLRFSFATLLLA